VRYPVACSPQAWAAGALPFLLQTALGLTPDATRGELVIRQPALPDWLGEATVIGLQVGEASVDLRFRRSGTATHVTASRQRGKLRVRVESRQPRSTAATHTKKRPI
jgi:hypothetical protein